MENVTSPFASIVTSAGVAVWVVDVIIVISIRPLSQFDKLPIGAFAHGSNNVVFDKDTRIDKMLAFLLQLILAVSKSVPVLLNE